MREKLESETKELRSRKKCSDLDKKSQILQVLVALLLHLAAKDALQLFTVMLVDGGNEVVEDGSDT